MLVPWRKKKALLRCPAISVKTRLKKDRSNYENKKTTVFSIAAACAVVAVIGGALPPPLLQRHTGSHIRERRYRSQIPAGPRYL